MDPDQDLSGRKARQTCDEIVRAYGRGGPLLHFILFAQTGNEKRFAMHAGILLRDLCGQGSWESWFPHLLLLVVGFISSVSRSWACALAACMKPDVCIQASCCIRTNYMPDSTMEIMQLSIRGEGWFRLHCMYWTKFLSQSAAMSDQCWNVTCMTCVYLNVKNSSCGYFQHQKQSVKCMCVCVYECVCLPLCVCECATRQD